MVQQLGIGLQAGLPLTVADDPHLSGRAVVIACNGAPAAPDDQVVTLGNAQRRDGGGGALKRRRAVKPDGCISGHQGRSEGNAEVTKNGHGRTPFRERCRPGICSIDQKETVTKTTMVTQQYPALIFST